MANERLKLIALSFALLISPGFVRAETTICSTSRVIYESKPSLKTECNTLHSTESRLTQGINQRSSEFDESIKAEQKLANMFGIIIRPMTNGESNYIHGFPDQKISYEGAELEKIYNIMLRRQYGVEPIRTEREDNPFSTFIK